MDSERKTNGGPMRNQWIADAKSMAGVSETNKKGF